jgi:magnesium transporter
LSTRFRRITGLCDDVTPMNFEHMPELHWMFGYAWALGLIGVACAVTFWLFKRNGWF